MKHQNKILAMIVICIVFLTSGCGTNDYLKDENGNIIVNEATGQSVQKDILCQPAADSELYKIYQDHADQLSVKVEDLPLCSEFSLTSNEYNGLWEAILVRPLALVILKFGYLFNNFGISVMFVGLLIRLILLPFSLKSMRQTNNMQKAQPEIARIEKKYENKTDSDSMMAKSQEMMMVYQKYKINPVSGCLVALIQIPLFFAFLSAINKVPAIFEGELFGMNLGMTPWKGLGQGEYIYIVLIFLIVATTYLSFKNTMKNGQNNEMMKQMNFMFMFVIISISIASFSLPTAIAFYWIVVNGFAVVQNYIIKKILSKEELGTKPKSKEKKSNKKVIEVKHQEKKVSKKDSKEKKVRKK